MHKFQLGTYKMSILSLYLAWYVLQQYSPPPDCKLLSGRYMPPPPPAANPFQVFPDNYISTSKKGSILLVHGD